MALFGVFDGHGGSEVSLFVKDNFVEELKKLQTFKNGNYEAALSEVFKLMDDMLMSASGQAELRRIQESRGGGGAGAAMFERNNKDNEA